MNMKIFKNGMALLVLSLTVNVTLVMAKDGVKEPLVINIQQLLESNPNGYKKLFKSVEQLNVVLDWDSFTTNGFGMQSLNIYAGYSRSNGYNSVSYTFYEPSTNSDTFWLKKPKHLINQDRNKYPKPLYSIESVVESIDVRKSETRVSNYDQFFYILKNNENKEIARSKVMKKLISYSIHNDSVITQYGGSDFSLGTQKTNEILELIEIAKKDHSKI